MKKIINKNQYFHLNKQFANKMQKDTKLLKKASEVFIEADKYRWLYQFSWFGEPLINLTTDMFAIQEIIYKTKPKTVIEIGVAWGGSLLFYSFLQKFLNNGNVIGVDIFIPNDLRKRINNHNKKLNNIKLIKGSSLDYKVINKINSILKDKNNLVILDSHHTYEHVKKELNIYSDFVGKGNYLVCCDTIVNRIPEQKHRKREWGPKNNPETALKEFLKKNKRFFYNKIYLNFIDYL